MAYGFEVYDQIGNLTSSSDQIMRVLATITHGDTNAVNTVIADYSDTTCFTVWLGAEFSLAYNRPTISWNSSTSTLTVTPRGVAGTVVVGAYQ